jgi:pimeloyl-ACP methyl ester carboxylesterase
VTGFVTSSSGSDVGSRSRFRFRFRPTARPPTAVAAAVAVGAGLGVIVGRDGSPWWQVVRLLLVVLVVGLAVERLAHGAGRSRIVVALVLGGAAIAVGVGFGGPHAAKEGATVPAVAGLAVLIGGLVVFAAGVGWLWRSASRWARLPATLAAAISVFILCWTLGQAVAATNVPRPELGSRTPGDMGLAFRDVEFEATDGVRLSGWYLPSRNGAAVVLLHGAGSTRSNVLSHAGVLAEHGYGVLLYDARGHGRSAGRAMDFGWYGDRDLGGAVAFLERQTDVSPGRIAAAGLSMGGEQAIGAAASLPAIRAVVAEGATTRVAGDKAWLSEEFGLRGALSEVMDVMTYGFADLLTDAGPPVTLRDAVAAARVPTLLIAAGEVPDEPRASRYIASAAPETVELWVVPGTGHTDALATHPDQWEARVTSFLDRSLG